MIKDNFASILESSSNRFPSNLALITEDCSITYENLYMRVQSIACSFIDLGIKPGDTVVCVLPNGIEMVTTHFAAAKIWTTLVPLNIHLKPRELNNILKHTKPRLLIVHASMANLVEALDKNITKDLLIIWDGKSSGKSTPQDINFADLIGKYPRLNIYPETRQNEICNILYTSGITGNPKGVMRTHENNLWAAISVAMYMPYKPGDLELFWLPMSSIGFSNIFIPNILGGSTVLLQEGFNVEAVLKAFDHYPVSRIYLVPQMGNQLISDNHLIKHDTSSLKQLIIGSAPLTIETKIRINRAFPSAKIYEVWGTTEGGHIGLEPEESLTKLGSIGKPLCFNEAKIVDEHGFKVAPGMVGEILIRGKSVTHGYFKNDEETKRCLPSDNGWFYTGDLARYDEDGYYYLTGRKSDMIISGENKIYPQEVEEVLLMHPQVLEAAVFGYPDKVCGELVVAIVVKQKDSTIEKKDLNDFLDKYIANYKKPQFIFFSSDLPKTATGKIMKNKLKNTIESNL